MDATQSPCKGALLIAIITRALPWASNCIEFGTI